MEWPWFSGVLQTQSGLTVHRHGTGTFELTGAPISVWLPTQRAASPYDPVPPQKTGIQGSHRSLVRNDGKSRRLRRAEQPQAGRCREEILLQLHRCRGVWLRITMLTLPPARAARSAAGWNRQTGTPRTSTVTRTGCNGTVAWATAPLSLGPPRYNPPTASKHRREGPRSIRLAGRIGVLLSSAASKICRHASLRSFLRSRNHPRSANRSGSRTGPTRADPQTRELNC